MKQRICFIINPIAGLGIQKINRLEIKNYFPKKSYKVFFKETQYSGHAALLAREAITEGADIIVACGGDGTINEIASELVGKKTALGFLPIGSGNGLATNLNIPKNLDEALLRLSRLNTQSIDVGQINNTYFFSNMGIGFDAEVLHKYKRIKNRPFLSYLKAVFNAFLRHKNTTNLEFTSDDFSISLDPFMFFVANSNQLGYNISLSRNASLTDGLLDLVIIKRQPKYKLLFLGLLMLLKKEKYFKGMITYPVRKIKVKLSSINPFYLQKDGELCRVNDNELSITVLNHALRVIC